MTSLYKIDSGQLSPVQRKTLANEEMIETWVAKDPSLVGLDVLVIGRQVITDFNGRIDILAINREGDLIIIELKRDRTPRDIVAQILDYASWVAGLTTKQVHDVAMDKLGKRLEIAFQERFDTALPETLNGDHRMVIVASAFDESSSRIVEYLAQEHDIAINAAFFNVFEENGQQFLTTDWLMDQEEVIERSESKKKLPWSGFWYANAGDGRHRSWEDMRKYGFLAAGGGRKYSGALDKLSVGNAVYVYQKKAGYVGYGIVTSTSVMVRDFAANGKPLLEQPLAQPNLAHDKNDPENAEYAVGMKWLKTFPVAEGKFFPEAFSNQNVVCKLRQPATLDFLKRTFNA